MGDKIDIYKITLEFLKGNKVFLYIVVALFGGGAAGHFVPPLMTAKPVEVTVNVPKNNELKVEIKRLKKEIKNLKRWHQ